MPSFRCFRSTSSAKEFLAFRRGPVRLHGRGPDLIQFGPMATQPQGPAPAAPDSLKRVAGEVHACHRCPRLVEWREASAAAAPRRFRGEDYWARPVAGFGDPGARLAIVGLAPAAHGANRTGRMFTGDRSGEWLYAACL